MEAALAPHDPSLATATLKNSKLRDSSVKSDLRREERGGHTHATPRRFHKPDTPVEPNLHQDPEAFGSQKVHPCPRAFTRPRSSALGAFAIRRVISRAGQVTFPSWAC